MTSSVRHRSDPGPTKKPIISSFFGSFIVPVFKTLVVCMYVYKTNQCQLQTKLCNISNLR